MSGMRLLDLPLIRRVRQNHAVEHATITMLMARHRSLPLVGGRSNLRGYYVFGAVETEQLAAAARDALARLQRGEAALAIHPNCGTNLVTTGAMAGLATLAATAISRRLQASLADSWLTNFTRANLTFEIRRADYIRQTDPNQLPPGVTVEDLQPELREHLLSAVELATDDVGSIHDSPGFRQL